MFLTTSLSIPPPFTLLALRTGKSRVFDAFVVLGFLCLAIGSSLV